jgi:hypothetical protein
MVAIDTKPNGNPSLAPNSPTILAALSAGAVVVNALPVEDGSKSGDPFAVLDPQNWVNPDDSQ